MDIRGQQVSRHGEPRLSWGEGRLLFQAIRRESRTDPRQSPLPSEALSAIPALKPRNPTCQEAFPTQPGAAGPRFRRSAGKRRRGPGQAGRLTAGTLRRRRAPSSAGSLNTAPQTMHAPGSGRTRQGRGAARPALGSVLAVSPPAPTTATPTRSRHPPLTLRFLARRPRPSAAIARVNAGRTARAWNSPRRTDWPPKRARAPVGGRARTRGTAPKALTGRGPAPRWRARAPCRVRTRVRTYVCVCVCRPHLRAGAADCGGVPPSALRSSALRCPRLRQQHLPAGALRFPIPPCLRGAGLGPERRGRTRPPPPRQFPLSQTALGAAAPHAAALWGIPAQGWT